MANNEKPIRPHRLMQHAAGSGAVAKIGIGLLATCIPA